MVEHVTFNHGVAGSIPTGSPTFAHACPRSVSYGWQATRRLARLSTTARDLSTVAAQRRWKADHAHTILASILHA